MSETAAMVKPAEQATFPSPPAGSRPPHRPQRRPALAGWLALVALVAFVALTLLATQRWWLAPAIAHLLARESGRDVAFERITVGLTLGLEPIVAMRGVRIANAPWADRRQPLVDLAEAVAVVSWRSVAERRPVIASLRLRGGSVDLERQADGHRNWRLRNPDDVGPGRYKILALEAHDATVRFAHRGIDLDFTARATPAPGGDTRLPTRIEADGAWRGVRFAVDTLAGRELTFVETGRRFPLRGDATTDGVRLEVDGEAGDLFREPTIDAKLRVAGTSLAALVPFLGEHYARPRRFDASARLVADERRYRLDDLHATVGTTDLAGHVVGSRLAGTRSLSGAIASESADLADLLWLAGRERVDADAAKQVATAPRPAIAIRPDLDIDVAYAATRLRSSAWPMLQSAAAHAVVKDGAARLDDVDVGVAGGRVLGRVAYDTRPPNGRAIAELAWRGVQLARVSPKLGERVGGRLEGRLDLGADGRSLDAWKRSAEGRATVTIVGGTIDSLLDAELGLEGGKLVRTLLSGREPLPLECAGAAVDLKGGKARITRLVVVSSNTRTRGSGTIDLGGDAIDVVLTPEPVRPGALELKRSIRLHGPLARPERSLIEKVAGAPAACPA